MSNGLHKRNKKNNAKEYNSWIAVIAFSLIDVIFSASTSGSEYGGESVSFFDMKEKLGAKGKRKQESLGIMTIFLISIFILVLQVHPVVNIIFGTLAVVCAGLLICRRFYTR